MLKTFPPSFVWIAWLVRIGNKSGNASHKETICVETALIVSPKYLKIDSTRKLSFPMLTSLKDAVGEDTISPEHLRYTKFLLSER